MIRDTTGTLVRDVILGEVPTVLVTGPYRMYFYSHEPKEPAHSTWTGMTVPRSSGWTLLRLPRTWDSRQAELRRIQRLVVHNSPLLLEKWHECFPS